MSLIKRVLIDIRIVLLAYMFVSYLSMFLYHVADKKSAVCSAYCFTCLYVYIF